MAPTVQLSIQHSTHPTEYEGNRKRHREVKTIQITGFTETKDKDVRYI